MKVIDVEWIGNKNLPTEVEAPDNYNIFEIGEWLMEKYHCDIEGYCVLDEKGLSTIIVEPD
jgi:hypothetical protein